MRRGVGASWDATGDGRVTTTPARTASNSGMVEARIGPRNYCERSPRSKARVSFALSGSGWRRPVKCGRDLVTTAAWLAVAAAGCSEAEGPQFAPAPGQLAHVSEGRLDQPDIFLMNADGSGRVNLSDTLAVDGGPSWSPDGTKLVFESFRHGNDEIYVMNADGTGVTRLTADTSLDAQPAWAPGGTRIAFVSNRDGNLEIYLMDTGGGNVTRVTNDGANDVQPAWSPDGARLAFVTDRDGNGEIYVMDSTGANALNRTAHAAEDLTPAWSPDGSKIAFMSDRDGDFAIYVMNADGSGVVRLTTSVVAYEQPTWSPDGAYVAFDDGNDIWVMRADGTELRNITRSTFRLDHTPRWRPAVP
jgi:Tol biopolymer transport system component